MNRVDYGRQGERMAAEYLKAKGYDILAANARCGGGELDLVAAHGDVIVIVEVKRRASARHGTPAEAVNWNKRRRIISAAQAYVLKNGLENSKLRFDVLEITGDEIRHIISAFDATGFI